MNQFSICPSGRRAELDEIQEVGTAKDVEPLFVDKQDAGHTQAKEFRIAVRRFVMRREQTEDDFIPPHMPAGEELVDRRQVITGKMTADKVHHPAVNDRVRNTHEPFFRLVARSTNDIRNRPVCKDVEHGDFCLHVANREMPPLVALVITPDNRGLDGDEIVKFIFQAAFSLSLIFPRPIGIAGQPTCHHACDAAQHSNFHLTPQGIIGRSSGRVIIVGKHVLRVTLRFGARFRGRGRRILVSRLWGLSGASS